MKKREKQFYDLLKRNKVLPGVYSRVENYVDKGTPDVSACCVQDYWVELKICNNKLKLVEPSNLLEESQLVWHTKRCAEGSIIFVMVRYPKWISLYKCVCVNKMEGKYDEITYKPINHYKQIKNTFGYEQITREIIEAII